MYKQSALNRQPATINSWLKAFRLRTLPLAFSSIAMGSFIAGAEGLFKWPVFLLAICTTFFLQILSNLANDYGDTVHGADNEDRLGPARSVQSGEISLPAMKRAVILFALLSLASGIALIYSGLKGLSGIYLLAFFVLGLSAIAAAIKYTAGKNPYGYKGLGDLFVFLFFGVVGVTGTYFLHSHYWNFHVLLPAFSLGFLSTGVLNVNNMRDRISDKNTGKITLAVRLGATSSKYYHLALIALAFIMIVIYTFLNFNSGVQLIFLISLPLFLIHLVKVFKNRDPMQLDQQLKFLVLSTLAFCLAFGAGLLL